MLRVEAGEMQRLIRSQFFANPGAHAPDGVDFICIGRYYQVDDLEPYPQVSQRFQGIEDGLELAGVKFGVNVLVKSFQITCAASTY